MLESTIKYIMIYFISVVVYTYIYSIQSQENIAEPIQIFCTI